MLSAAQGIDPVDLDLGFDLDSGLRIGAKDAPTGDRVASLTISAHTLAMRVRHSLHCAQPMHRGEPNSLLPIHHLSLPAHVLHPTTLGPCTMRWRAVARAARRRLHTRASGKAVQHTGGHTRRQAGGPVPGRSQGRKGSLRNCNCRAQGM